MSKWGVDGVEITPGNYDAALAVGEMLTGITDEQIEDCMSRVEGQTNDPAKVAMSLRKYRIELSEKREERQERVESQNGLVGRDKLYEVWIFAKKTMHLQPTAQSDIDENCAIGEARKELPNLLKQWGYESEEAFENSVRDYAEDFRNEAVNIANDAMDYTEAEMYRYEQSLSDNKLNTMLEQLQLAHSADGGKQFQYIVLDTIVSGSKELTELVSQLRITKSAFNIDDAVREALMGARTASELKKKIGELLEERRAAIDETRERLEDDPDLIWSFDAAIAQARVSTNVGSTGIHDAILDDEAKRHARDKLARELTLGGAAMIGGFLAGGPAGSAAAVGAVVGMTTAGAEA